jgi:acetylornithine deacetylase
MAFIAEINVTITIDEAYLLETARALVRIDSVNPSISPGGGGESAIAAFVAGELARIGLEVTQYEPAPGRISVVGRLPGRGGGRSLMWNAHMDTVGVAGMAEPFAARVENGRLYGRGAYDMKGSLAAQLAAARALREAGIVLAGDLLVAAVADEEYASIGTADLLRHVRPDAAIVTEPTALQPCVVHKGFIWLEITTHGRAAHGSRPALGIDANMHMGRVLCELERMAEELQERPGHPLVGPPSLHAAMLAGGTDFSTYAARCTLHVERRTVPGEMPAIVKGEMLAMLEELAAADPCFDGQMELLLTRDSFETRSDSAILPAVEQAAMLVLGVAPPRVGESFWMDSAFLAAAGIDTVIIGPSGEGAHAAEEWVELDSLARLAAILAQSTMAYCGTITENE